MNAMKSMYSISIRRAMATTCEKAQGRLMLLESTVMSRLAISTTQVCIWMALTLSP